MHVLTSGKRLIGILLFAWIIHAPLAQAILIELQPGATFADPGESVSLDLVISGLGDSGPDSLGAFDISVAFDPTVLSFTGYALGNYLGTVGLGEAIDGSGGGAGSSVNLAEVSLLSAVDLDTLQPGAFTMATLNFDVIDLEAGEQTLLSILSGWVLADGAGLALTASSAGPASVQRPAIDVPAPGTLFLVLPVMLGWLASRKSAICRGVE